MPHTLGTLRGKGVTWLLHEEKVSAKIFPSLFFNVGFVTETCTEVMLLLCDTISSELQVASQIAALRGFAGQWQSTCLAAERIGVGFPAEERQDGKGKGERDRREGKYTFLLR